MSGCSARRIRNGAKFEIVALPCPAAVYYEDARLPASYANFYIANEVVLVPIFDDAHDEAALGNSPGLLSTAENNRSALQRTGRRFGRAALRHAARTGDRSFLRTSAALTLSPPFSLALNNHSLTRVVWKG